MPFATLRKRPSEKPLPSGSGGVTERLSDDFFVLRTGLAGAITQKFVNYHQRLAVVGDLSAKLAESNALRSWVEESNRGRHLWFVATLQELNDRLQAHGG